VFEGRYFVPAAPVIPPETHVVITWIDEDSRLVVRTSNESPFHLRRTLASLLGLPVGTIRVLTPRIGAAFGGKQEILNEDLSAFLTLRSGRPVRLRSTRDEELLTAPARSRETITVKSGVREGLLTTLEMRLVSDTGASGARAQALASGEGMRILSLYSCPNRRYEARGVYTNLPPAGAFRGKGWPQGLFALESHVDEVALELGEDPLEFRKRNSVRAGAVDPFAGVPHVIQSCGLEKALQQGAKAIGWSRRRKSQRRGSVVTGLGMAIATHASPAWDGDRSSVDLRMNEDGSFHLLIGGRDAGGDSETALQHIAAEALGTDPERVFILAGDTDLPPVDSGGHTASTLVAVAWALEAACGRVRTQILEVGGRLLGSDPSALAIESGRVRAPNGRSVTHAEVAHRALALGPAPIAAAVSRVPRPSPLPFTSVFAEVEVDTDTGELRLRKLVQAVDCGRAASPSFLTAQIEGGALRGLGYALGSRLATLPRAADAPEFVTFLVATDDPAGPFGLKPLGATPFAAAAPAIANAVAHALGVRIRTLPLTPEEILTSLASKAR
jgi:putative selenate reductase molybdopterin-binding subunit